MSNWSKEWWKNRFNVKIMLKAMPIKFNFAVTEEYHNQMSKENRRSKSQRKIIHVCLPFLIQQLSMAPNEVKFSKRLGFLNNTTQKNCIDYTMRCNSGAWNLGFNALKAKIQTSTQREFERLNIDFLLLTCHSIESSQICMLRRIV